MSSNIEVEEYGDSPISALLLDIGGVLTEDGQALPGAVSALAELATMSLPVRLLTNTSKRTRSEVLAEMLSLGFALRSEQLITAPTAVRHYLLTEQLRPFLICTPALQAEFSDIPQDKPNAVVVFDAAEHFHYRVLDDAFQLLQSGAPLIAVGDNRYYSSGGRRHLDAGPFIRALAYAADVEPTIIGKPAARFFQDVAASLGVDDDGVLMVGDDVLSDVLGAQNAGLRACLVRSGKYRRGDEGMAPSAFCINGIADLPALVSGLAG